MTSRGSDGYAAETAQNVSVTSLKRELQESPNSKARLRDFMKEMHGHEKSGFEAVYNMIAPVLSELPRKVMYRGLLELADLAKRENRLNAAKALYRVSS
jgi:hypothetical protein